MDLLLKKRVSRSYIASLLLSAALVFVLARPLNNPWQPFIAGDGLGYYSYLPALFIYNDKDLSWEWFNEAHNRNYVYSVFENPEDNLLVEYNGRKINKYYQGLSFIWLPFFCIAHVLAQVSPFAADGYSMPYQLAIGLASLVYLLLGLYFLFRLILHFTLSNRTALFLTAAMFYGTWLFTYSVHTNSLSHLYSFTFVTGFYRYCTQLFFTRQIRYLYPAIFCLIITVCIRPLTGLAVFAVPAFIPSGFRWRSLSLSRLKPLNWLLLIFSIAAIYFTLSLNYTQTGSLVAYNYTGEGFDFGNARFSEALFSYHNGTFVYVPLLLLSFGGLAFMSGKRRLILPVLFLAVIYLYSAWWYWSIVKRGLVDFYVFPALMLGGYYSGLKQARYRLLISVLIVLCTVYFQFKAMQIRRGVLDENYTHSELFWANFFKVERSNLYVVPPSSILHHQQYDEDLESEHTAKSTKEKSHTGSTSLVLDKNNFICTVAEHPLPAFYSGEGIRQMRLSFYGYFEKGLSSVHIFFQFYDKQGEMIFEKPFYLNEEDIKPERWDYKEFGAELGNDDIPDISTIDKVRFTIWNVKPDNRLFIDDVRTEFFLTDRRSN